MATGSAVITGGLVLAGTGQAAPADLVLRDDRIEALAPPRQRHVCRHAADRCLKPADYSPD